MKHFFEQWSDTVQDNVSEACRFPSRSTQYRQEHVNTTLQSHVRNEVVAARGRDSLKILQEIIELNAKTVYSP